MDAYFINLDRAADRRAFLESAFSEFAPPSWRLNRVAAVTTPEVAAMNVAGNIRPAEKACLLSHRKAIEMSLAADGPSLILEDDALFGPSAFPSFDALAPLLANPDIDLVYTDICVPNVHSMIDLFLTYRGLVKDGTLKFLNLKRQVYAGATAYFVNPGSKRKLLSLLDGSQPLDVPYDLLLRKWVHEGPLNALSVFPFLTSLSRYADDSQIQLRGPSTDAPWNAFRRLMWIDAERYGGDPTEALDRIDGACADIDTLRFAKVLQAALARDLGAK